MNGASGLYEGSTVNTVGAPAGNPATVVVLSTIPGRIPPLTEPTPGKKLPPVGPAIGNPREAFVPVEKPNKGPVENPRTPKLPASPPPNGNATNGCDPAGRKTAAPANGWGVNGPAGASTIAGKPRPASGRYVPEIFRREFTLTPRHMSVL